MRRRDFIALGSAAAAWSIEARAQQPALPVVGFLGSDSPELYTDRLRAFRRGLRDAGYIESENVVIEYRWANGDNNRLPALAAELVGLRVNVLISSTTPAALALKAATTSIPIVFFIAGDPVALGLVGSLNRPGANITGATALTLEAGKNGCSFCGRRCRQRPNLLFLSTRPAPILPRPKKMTCRQLRATSISGFIC
jgi:putative tryptophan/tyrosine transport system substrate-binding protein